jgi:hypothetical protein
MKKTNLFLSTIIASIAISLVFVSCEKDDNLNYSELLKGTWVNTMINDQAVLTDASFIMELRSDNTELYAIGILLDENNKSWQETTSNTYSVSGDMIIIDGSDELNNSKHLEFEIQTLDDKTLVYTVLVFTINGEVVSDENTYTFKKFTNDYSTDFTGVWYGHCTTESNTDSLFHYWEYFDDGNYNYYYQNENSKWIKKSDNEGRYFLYGNLMASNYSNDLINGGKGKAFECWNFTLDVNNMVWTGLRENNVTITYEMEKVSSAPETMQ